MEVHDPLYHSQHRNSTHHFARLIFLFLIISSCQAHFSYFDLLRQIIVQVEKSYGAQNLTLQVTHPEIGEYDANQYLQNHLTHPLSPSTENGPANLELSPCSIPQSCDDQGAVCGSDCEIYPDACYMRWELNIPFPTDLS